MQIRPEDKSAHLGRVDIGVRRRKVKPEEKGEEGGGTVAGEGGEVWESFDGGLDAP